MEALGGIGATQIRLQMEGIDNGFVRIPIMISLHFLDVRHLRKRMNMTVEPISLITGVCLGYVVCWCIIQYKWEVKCKACEFSNEAIQKEVYRH